MGRFRVRTIVVLIVVVSVSMLLISCAPGTKTVVGTWRVDEKRQHVTKSITFRADGTGELAMENQSTQSFEYTFDDSRKPACLEVLQTENGRKMYWPNTIVFRGNDTIEMGSGDGPNNKPGQAFTADETLILHRMK